MKTFKPSQVDLRRGYPPLIGTFGRSEFEVTVAVLVRACQANGDTWHPVSDEELARTVNNALGTTGDPIKSIVTNPFLHPDFDGLVEGGLLVRSDAGFELVPEAIERLRKYVS